MKKITTAVVVIVALFIAGCVITFRTAKQKTAESEMQLGVSGPNSEFSSSRINTQHSVKDTFVRVHVRKDTVDRVHVKKDTTDNE